MSLKYFASLFFLVLLLLLALEIVALLLLPSDARQPFFLNLPTKQLYHIGDKSILFQEVDPLLGWAMSPQQLDAKGFDTDSGIIVLNSCVSSPGASMRILITGGSTTDLATIGHNWPLELAKILTTNNIKATLYIGAVGGYNSGQELLRLLRDKAYVRPALHISYSGANESEPSLVTNREMKLYEHLITLSASPFLPNVLAWINYEKGEGRLSLRSYYTSMTSADFANEASAFWLSNMRSFYALAQGDGYCFYGVLQPVLGSGTYKQDSLPSYAIPMVVNYKRYYPLLATAVAKHPHFLIDFKNLFDQAKGTVYTDDCHLNVTYQHVLAQAIFDELNKRNAWRAGCFQFMTTKCN